MLRSLLPIWSGHCLRRYIWVQIAKFHCWSAQNPKNKETVGYQCCPSEGISKESPRFSLERTGLLELPLLGREAPDSHSQHTLEPRSSASTTVHGKGKGQPGLGLALYGTVGFLCFSCFLSCYPLKKWSQAWFHTQLGFKISKPQFSQAENGSQNKIIVK